MGEGVDAKQTVDVDDVLVKFNIFGRYHLWCLLLLLLVNITTSMTSVNYIFAAEEVAYKCKDNENSTCDSYNSTHQCSEWIYENPNSLVAEFGLACQDWKRTFIGSIHSVGYMSGLSIIGPMSDRIGRKYTIVITAMINAVLGALRSFSNGYWLYVSLEFLEAMSGGSFSPVYMLGVELVATKKRITYITFCNIGWHIGYALLAPTAWYFPYWRHLLRVVYLPNLFFFFYIFLLDESPRWLLSKGRNREAMRIIQKAGDISRIKIDKYLLENITYQKEKNLKFTELLKSTFASKTLLNRFLICSVWWTTCAFVSYGMIINSVSLQGSKYWNFSIMCMIDIPGSILNMLALKYFKRKYSLILTFFLGAVLCSVQPFVPKNISTLSVALYMAGKVMSACYFDTTYLFTSELFPTYTRNSMHALCSSIGRIGSVLAPQTPLLMAYWTGLPPLIFGSVALFAGVLTFFVPDTSDNSLPDTVKQAEAVGFTEKHNTTNNIE